MELDHSFTVPVGIDEAWSVLLDIERVAPCMPGAALDTVDGDDFTGSVKVKLGPISLTYKGKAAFVEKDATAHRAVIDARGRDARGNGTAAAKVTATLREDAGSTAVDVHTDLNITGKPAQFGRGVMTDVGNKLIGQFSDNLAAELSGRDDADETGPAPETAGAGPGTRRPEAAGAGPGVQPPATSATGSADVEAINLFGSAGPAVAKRLAPVAAAVLVIVLIMIRRKRKR
jgi:carbon monoxide dehydrogenase subunit G